VTDTKQQTNFVHKKPMRAVTVEQNSACSKLKLTIPREPDLKTAHRAQRIRPKIVGEAEHMTVAAPRFKARPLNRRILEAPSLPLPILVHISIIFSNCVHNLDSRGSFIATSQKEHSALARISRVSLEDYGEGYATHICYLIFTSLQ
ncbi:cell cycle regulated microtubule-associated protein, partial [Trifolium pratense]